VLISKTSRKRIDLSGTWKFAVDPDDRGLEEEWHRTAKNFRSRINVPGTIQGQGLGKQQHLSIRLWADDGFPLDLPWLRSEYSGTAWYRRDLDVPAAWRNKQVWLEFTGIHPACEIWVNESHVAEHMGLNRPLRLRITDELRSGRKNTLTVRMFEAYRYLEGCYKWPHWSGIYGTVYLEATDSAWIDDVFVRTDIARQKVHVETTIKHASSADDRPDADLKISCEVCSADKPDCLEKFAKNVTRRGRTEWTVVKSKISLSAPVKEWSPDSPNLYRVRVGLYGNGKKLDDVTETFGFRDIRVSGKKFLLNGKPLYIRSAGLMGNYHPLELAPTADRRYYRKMLLQAKNAGFNCIRGHTYSPTRACLDVADEIGILIQSELPIDNRNHPLFTDDVSFTEKLWREMIVRDRNHPSVIIWSMGNEMQFGASGLSELTASLYKLAKKTDPTRLVLNCDGWLPPSPDKRTTDFHSVYVGGGAGYFIDHHKSIQEEIAQARKPVLVHEFGYGCTFPDVRRKGRYSGDVVPYWLRLTEKISSAQGVKSELPVFVRNSLKLYEMCAKMGLEEIHKIPGVSGYCWWMLKDATHVTTGVLDDFCNLKISSFDQFRQSNSDVVLLINTPDSKHCFTAGESVGIDILVSNRQERLDDAKGARLSWNLVDGKTVIDEGRITVVPHHGVSKAGRVNFKMPVVRSGRRLTLRAELTYKSKQISSNQWDLWAFPGTIMTSADAEVLELDPAEDQRFGFRPLSDDYSFIRSVSTMARNKTNAELLIARKGILAEDMLSYLNKGGKVFLMTRGCFPLQESTFETLWDGVNSSGNMGTVVEKHPALKKFPHDGYCALQFFDLIGGGRHSQWSMPPPVFDLDKWPVRIRPIIRSIDSYKTCANRAYLFEVRVGKGKLLATTLEFTRWRRRHIEARYLFDQLLRYALSDEFRPKVSVSASQLKKICSSKLGSW